MLSLTTDKIKKDIADSTIIFHRGQHIYEEGALFLSEQEDEYSFAFKYDGNYGDYKISIDLTDLSLPWLCDCPYPGEGCKHVVAALLSVMDFQDIKVTDSVKIADKNESESEHMTWEEIRQKAFKEREKSAAAESFQVVAGETFKGEHLLYTTKNRQYNVVMHNPETGQGHCNCPDFITNRLGTCKHIIYLQKHFEGLKNFKKQTEKEAFPFADIFWNSKNNLPELYYEKGVVNEATAEILNSHFDENRLYKNDFSEFTYFCSAASGNKQIIIQPDVIRQLQKKLEDIQLRELEKNTQPDYTSIHADLYAYQKEGVQFGLFKKSVLIGDEMGLGKTLQAISLSVFKKNIFDFKNVLIVTLASLKDQWQREIARFSDETSVVVAGTAEQRKNIYKNDQSFFKITNYEAVLRDTTIISEMKPDIVILDEAQRIKNFTTKTADAVKSLPRDHAIVLTGTPLENKLEDVYSIVQFLDPFLLSPLWNFAGQHFVMPKKEKGKITGYKNLKELKSTLSSIVIRRKKEEVLKDLPETVTNNYYIDLSHQQEKLHAGFMYSLLPILGKNS